MMTAELVEFTEKARLLQIYTNSYCTVIDGDFLYLLENVQINPKNVIAKIDIEENCEIFDRDKANVFIDFSHMHFGNKDNIEDLPEQQIKQYIIEFLVQDINELLDFTQNNYSYIDSLINYFDSKTQDKIHKAMKSLGLHEVPFVEVYSFNQLDFLVKKQYYYICFNLAKLKYAVSSSNYEKYYTNGACGNWSKLIKNKDFKVIFFNKNDACIILDKNIESLLKKDLEQSTDIVITHLLKLEDKLCKSLNELVSILSNKNGLIKVEKLHYPEIKDTIGLLEALLNNYQKAISEEDRLSLFNLLKEKYAYIYSEFGKAQKNLKDLYKLVEKEKVNG